MFLSLLSAKLLQKLKKKKKKKEHMGLFFRFMSTVINNHFVGILGAKQRELHFQLISFPFFSFHTNTYIASNYPKYTISG